KKSLVAETIINGVRALTLFDSGCTLDSITPAFATAANVKVRNLKASVGLQLGTVGSRASIERGAVVSFQFGKIDVKSQYIDVLNVSRYDAVIGTVTMRRWGIKLDFGTDTI
ncbi:hypothetical protein DFP72DRAFT_751439, partial [Ephemerocybe angulata]